MKSVRKISRVWKSKATIEGAVVHLKRAFGNSQVPLFDPFLMLDDFHSINPPDYLKGFPCHPHRGIETITYVLHFASYLRLFDYPNRLIREQLCYAYNFAACCRSGFQPRLRAEALRWASATACRSKHVLSLS